MEKSKKKKIIWIDKNIYNEENTHTYNEFVYSLPEFDIIKCKSVKETFDYISENYEADFKFKLFYVIVSGALSEEFFNEYVKKTLEIHILCATIIYCSEEHRKKNEFKPFYLDNFLNPGKVTDSSYFVIEYIKSIECKYYLEADEFNLKNKKEEKEEINDKDKIEFAAEFTYIKDLGEIAYPIIISKYINSTLIEKEELETIQEEYVKSFPQLKYLFRPSEEKNIFIPYHILAKYYLYAYTKNSNFYAQLNKELRERKFDDHRIYIYLMYNALNKGIFKSYSQSNLYRGGTLSKEEFENLKKQNEKQKNSKSETNKIFFFSRKFLSFSKEEWVANNFLQTAILCEYSGVYVRFIVEGINDDDFFVSNIDINAMNLSAFSEEEEVLFLPLSCFEVVSIDEENFCENNIKVIRLRYLNQYKDLIHKNFENIAKEQKGDVLEKFINDAVNSKYSKELCKYLGYDFNKHFYVEIGKKTNVELNYHLQGKKFVIAEEFQKLLKEMNDGGELLRNAEKFYDKLNTPIKSFQFGKYHGKDCIACFNEKGELLYLNDGSSCHVPSIKGKLEICNNQEICQKDFVPESDKHDVESLTIGKIDKLFYKFLSKSRKKNGANNKEEINKEFLIKEIKLKDSKNLYKQSGAVEANMVGNAIGYFLANYSEFKKANYKDKIKILENTVIPFGNILGKKIIGPIPVFKNNTVFQSIFRYGFLAISLFELSRNIFEVFFSDVLTLEEKIKIFCIKTLPTITDVGSALLSQAAAMKIALALGIVAGPGAIIISGIVGIGVGFIAGKIVGKIKAIEKERNFLFYSDSLYFKYVPKKYREYAIPTLKWKDAPLKSKSFALELIVNENGKKPNWLIINIPPKVGEMEINELSNEGETIIKYKGIPENAFSGCFCLYVFDINKINYDDFVAMKNGLEEGEKLRKHLIDYKMLIVT